MRYWQLNKCVFSCFLKTPSHVRRSQFSRQTVPNCDVYVGGKVRVSEFMIFLDLQHCGSK